ncbi:Protein-lysine n-methyltransferase eef2kmt [Thalictrum thalictroides]|uniref:Protein-lysine n-methyltransferase eef2kmt n=1 Tax=Thalictrum thalictroides TaxID=46969 RepID=A0A7J6VZL8_THATH|nr:Protein-lysine n-methyltransferase eef2kmt [Thalictrum thalictroides]
MEEEVNQELNPLSSPPCLHLISAFFAMEPNACLISLARECGGGSISNGVQKLILEHCINKTISNDNAPSNLYVKNFLKKVIAEVESSGNEVLNGLYDRFAYYITSVNDDVLAEDNTRVCKKFSFLFPQDCAELPSCPRSMKFEIPVQCSLNMLDGGTGCWIWPSSLYLSEFILSYPEIFTTKYCLEVGSGVGLVGICLAIAKASKVILTDGDMSTLATLKQNLELNQVSERDMSQGGTEDTNMVDCRYLSWESTSECELQGYTPDIVLGADVMYDPSCFPPLVRVLSILLKPNNSNAHQRNGRAMGSPTHNGFMYNQIDDDNKTTASGCCLRQSESDCNDNGFSACGGRAEYADKLSTNSPGFPIAYIATVIRNVDTYNYFLNLASQAQLAVVDITASQKPLTLLPYMQSYDRSSIRLLTLSALCD